MSDRPDGICRLPNRFPGLQQMISYAVANPAFAQSLVHDPPAALALLPAEISLNSEEDLLVRQVERTTNLHLFAAALHALIEDTHIIQMRQVNGDMQS